MTDRKQTQADLLAKVDAGNNELWSGVAMEGE